jgi:bifunctional N-acetylglucosamine-1-phosphate-uridyltransferase/glucosamine-1-phosphate-acetyltransferase GlmU-like protein
VLEPERTVLVVGHGAEAVAEAAREIDEHIAIAVQEEQKGTAHAVLAAAPALEGRGRRHGRPLRRHALHPARDAGAR